MLKIGTPIQRAFLVDRREELVLLLKSLPPHQFYF